MDEELDAAARVPAATTIKVKTVTEPVGRPQSAAPDSGKDQLEQRTRSVV